MEINTIINKLAKKQNGSYIKIKYISDLSKNLKASEKNNYKIEKIVTTTIRKGIGYKNIQSVKDRIGVYNSETDKIEATPQKMAWGEYVKGYEGLIIENKGSYYIRCYTTPNKPKTEYFVNGVKTTRDELINLNILIPSYFNKKSVNEVMTIKASNIEEIY